MILGDLKRVASDPAISPNRSLSALISTESNKANKSPKANTLSDHVQTSLSSSNKAVVSENLQFPNQVPSFMRNYVSATPSSRGGKSFQSEGNTPHNFSNNTSLSCMTFESIPTGPAAGFVSSTSDSQNINFNLVGLNVPTTTPDITNEKINGNTQNVQYFSENNADLYENDRTENDRYTENGQFVGQNQVLVAPRPIQQGISYPAYSFASSTNIQATIQPNHQNNNNNNSQSFSFSHRPPSVQQSQISQVAESVVTTTTAEGKKETTIGGCMLENEAETIEFDMYSALENG